MREIRLEFVHEEHLKQLIDDKEFSEEIKYLNPVLIEKKKILLFDPVEHHSPLETEQVVLTLFSRAMGRIVFANSGHEVSFKEIYLDKPKGGLIHKNEVVVTTDLIQITV